MTRILVTGGSGYIGSVIAALARLDGHEVLVIDRRAADNPLELTDPSVTHRLIQMLDGVDAVIHCAADSIVSEAIAHPARTWANNLFGTRNLLDAMANAGVSMLINSSTAAVYGSAIECEETIPCQPEHAYGRSKYAVELMISDQTRAHHLRATSLRYFNVAGAFIGERHSLGERHVPETHLIPNAITAALGMTPDLILHGDDWPTPDGTNVRDYIHVLDVAQAHLLALEQLATDQSPDHQMINIGSGRGYSNREVIATVERITGRTVPTRIGERRPGDPPRLVATIERAKTVLDWSPARTLEQMVRDAHDFMLSDLRLTDHLPAGDQLRATR